MPLARLGAYLLHAGLLALGLLAGPACRSPIGVTRVDPAATRSALEPTLLSSRRLSDQTRSLLRYFDLSDAYQDDPASALAKLHGIAASENLRGLYAALAELQYAQALNTRRRGDFLAAALFAQVVFFDTALAGDFTPYSAFFQQTREIYNHSLERCFGNPQGRLELHDEEIETPLGVVHLRVSRPGFPWGPEEFDDFRLADGLGIRGLRERVRISGLGVPLVAVHSGVTRKDSLNTLSPDQKVTLPATAFLRVQGERGRLLDGPIEAALELYLSLDQLEVEHNGRTAPLEGDLTAPLALSLENSSLWSFGLQGFLSGTSEAVRAGITMLQPYQPGKVPLLLIHGTASSSATFAQIINSLLADPGLRDRYQIWLSLYNTGNPILYSAGLQRAALVELLADLDPEGRDPALQQVVLVGHSQGGLIARLLVSSSGDQLWNQVFDVPPEELDEDEAEVKTLRAALIFDAVPQVGRVIFISTPHRGSFVAATWLGRLASDLVSVPKDLVDSVQHVSSEAMSRRSSKPKIFEDLPTSVENMQPGSRFNQALENFEFNPRVHLHSIIAGPTPNALRGSDDSVVTYESAHLDQAESEFVYQGRHTDQNSPPVVAELRRLLHEHLKGLPAPKTGVRPIP